MVDSKTSCSLSAATTTSRYLWPVAAVGLVFCLMALYAPAVGFAGQTAPERGQLAVDAGPGYYNTEYIGPSEQMRDGVRPVPGLQVGAVWHLGRFAAVTGRSGLWMTEAAVAVPTMAGIRAQLPLGSSTFSAGIEAGSNQIARIYDGFAGFVAFPAAGAHAGYEYTFDSGLRVGAQLGTEGVLFSGISASRAALTMGWQFQ